MSEPLRTLVVDDSTVFRQAVRRSLEQIDGVDVIGVARSGDEAIEKLSRLKPDVVTLDFEMPGATGLEVLGCIRKLGLATSAVMISSYTERGSDITTQCLCEGAFDFVLKPVGSNAAQELTRQLESTFECLKRSRSVTTPKVPTRYQGVRSSSPTPDVICIGISTGGPPALMSVLPKLPADFPIPILIVQHMPAGFTKSLAETLDKRSSIRVTEAIHGERLERSVAYIAPGGRHMELQRIGGVPSISLSDSPPEHSCRPSVDVLFRSVANVYSAGTLALIMTGMGHDGFDGCCRIHDVGGVIYSQSEQSCAVYGMPRKPTDEGLVEGSLSLEGITELLCRLAQPEVV